MKAVAKTEEAGRAGPLNGRQPAQRRLQIIGRKKLAEPREPARLFEVQVGDEQRFLGGQNSAPSALAKNVSPANEKGTMGQL